MVLVEPQDFWQDLFGHGEGGSQAVHVDMRMIRRHGRPFLLLPRQPRAAVAVVDLYPAQTLRARVARKLLRWLLHAPVAVGTERIALRLSAEDAFVKLLASLAGIPTSEVPTFGILAGNPASDGQRFLILVFDTNQKPVAVIKAGLTARAIELIRHEELFLGSVPGRIEGIPALRATFDSSRMRALVLDFFTGDSPRVKDEDAMVRLLSCWVHRQKELRLSELSGWTRLASSSAIAWFPALARRIGQQFLHPAIRHGDFVPWNIKVSPRGAWTVLDWERSELTGIPAWDWFHYVIQTGILVERQPTSRLVSRVESMLSSAWFQQYAEYCGIAGLERELALAYLVHCVEVIKPSEGLSAARELLSTLHERWVNVR